MQPWGIYCSIVDRIKHWNMNLIISLMLSTGFLEPNKEYYLLSIINQSIPTIYSIFILQLHWTQACQNTCFIQKVIKFLCLHLLLGTGIIMFSGCPSMCMSIHPSVGPNLVNVITPECMKGMHWNLEEVWTMTWQWTD